MLNFGNLSLDVNLDVDIKHARFPVYFKHKNTCIHCGADGQLVFVDKFGRETTKELTAFEHIKCRACGRIYSMRWEPDENDASVYRPSAVEFNVKKDLENLIDPNIRHRGDRSFN
jgi:ribosomal protein L37E